MLPQIGQVIWLSPYTTSIERSKLVYKSRVADIQNDMIIIELPINETHPSGISSYVVGSRWQCWYIGGDGSRFDFQTEIIGKRRENIPMLELKPPVKTEVTRTQRRHFVRVSTHVEIAVKIDDRVRNYHFLARTIDLSGGGLAFSCPDKYTLQEKDQLKIWLALPSKSNKVGHAYAVGEIIRVKRPEEKGGNQWVSVNFMEIKEGDRAKVIRACFERQLELRNKGIGE
ncbi:flagellar brake protein [Brevibacillus ginsengisoli]|uniref:flagellar brake protein n=1 Tax=Brevibacillus ginsengisoli TaxID=363854 RepID=UPI003CF46098